MAHVRWVFSACLLLVLICLTTAPSFATDVTFQVDMSLQESLDEFDPLTDEMAVKGSWNGWNEVTLLSDDDSDLIYAGMNSFSVGTYSYKFVILHGENVVWEMRENRTLVVGEDEIILPVVWYNDIEPSLWFESDLNGEFFFGNYMYPLWTSSTGSPVSLQLLRENNFVETIAEGITESQYDWLIDITDFGDGYQLRIDIDFAGTTYADTSETFQILSSMTISQPEGGEYPVGSTLQILWLEVLDVEQPLDLDLLHNGEWVENIASNITGTSEWAWQITPHELGDGYAIVASMEYLETTLTDTTSPTFSLTNPLQLTSLNAGETVATGTIASITWESSIQSSVNISLLQHGEWYSTIAAAAENTGEYDWMVEPVAGLNDFQIEITSTVGDYTYRDTSDMVFDMQLGNVQLVEVLSDTVHPSFVNVIYRVASGTGKAISFLDSLQYYDIREDGSAISETESIPNVGQVENLPFEQRTLLMLDNSFSIGLNLPTVKQAAKNAVRNRFANQSFAVWTFSEDVDELQSFTEDTTALIAAIDGIALGPASTNLYGAVVSGVAELVNDYSVDGIIQSSMLVMSDGEDTQGSTSETEALNAVSDQQVFTIAVGDNADTEALANLGSAGAYDGDFNDLGTLFGAIQRDIEDYANSFYWLVYISPSRNNSSVNLQLSIPSAINNPSIDIEFSSVGFSSVDPGVYVNRDFNALLGIEEYVYEGDTYQQEFTSQTLFGLLDPSFSWSVDDPGLIEVVDESGDMNEKAVLRVLVSDPFTTSVIVLDTENNYSKEISLISTGVAVEENPAASLPENYEMSQAWPNPFNPTTMVRINLPTASYLRVSVFNLLGQKVATLADQRLAAGQHALQFNGHSQASGLYLLRASVPGKWQETRKIMLLK
ncbi:VWA domain-containing protein [bacterium]|nr:VWA domain-containing protein [bacterium]